MNRYTALILATLSALCALTAPAQAATRRDVDSYLSNALRYQFSYDKDGDVQINFDDGSSLYLAFYDSRNNHIAKSSSGTTVDQIRFYLLSPLADKLTAIQAERAVMKLNREYTYKAYLTIKNRVTFAYTLACLADCSTTQVQKAVFWSVNSLLGAEKEFAKIAK